MTGLARWSPGTLLDFSVGASAVFVLLVVLAHVLNPEISPRWRMLSELALGRRGWVMAAAFVAWSASNLALARGLWSLVPSWTSIALVVVSLGPLGAAAALTDPITTPPGEATSRGRWHNAFGALFIFGLPVVAILYAIETLGNPLGMVAFILAVVVWVSLIGFIVMTGIWAREGRGFGPQTPIGIPNRIFAAAFVAWTLGMALAARPLLG